MKLKFDYWTVLTALLAALFVFASIVAYMILSVPRGGDLTQQERYGYPTIRNTSSSVSSTTGYVPHKEYSKGAWGISFLYPENFTVAESKDSGSNSITTLTGPQSTVVVKLFCADPAQVSDDAWESNFTNPLYISSIAPPVRSGSGSGRIMVQEIDKESVYLFASRLTDTSGARGYDAIACTSGENRKGSLAARCFLASTNMTKLSDDAYASLQDYFFDDFLGSVRFGDDFGNVINCPGLGD